MANGNPFAIDTGFGSNVVPAFSGLISDVRQEQQRDEALAKQSEKQRLAQEALASGDINQISQFMTANPQYAKAIESAYNFQSEDSRKNAVDAGFRILRGEDPQAVLNERAQYIQSMGGDPTQTLEALGDSPEDLEKGARLLVAQYGTPAQIAAIDSKRESGKDFQQVKTEGLEGYTFDPNTGSFSIDPAVKETLANKAADKAAEGSQIGAKDRKGINKDVTDLTKDARLISNTAKDLKRLGKIKSGPASIALVFKFMKALDPTSVVREGEFATAENSAGVPEGIRNIYNKVANGERLGQKQIDAFIMTAEELSDASSMSASEEVSSYLDAYEDTIPESFKEKLRNRIPRVERTAKKESGKRYADNVSKYLKAN